MNEDIINDFCKGSRLNCQTVEDVIQQLSRLPKDLKVEVGFGEGVDLVVFNYGMPSMHLSFEEAD